MASLTTTVYAPFPVEWDHEALHRPTARGMRHEGCDLSDDMQLRIPGLLALDGSVERSSGSTVTASEVHDYDDALITITDMLGSGHPAALLFPRPPRPGREIQLLEAAVCSA
ncbi:hypothetical protein CLCR_05273 [Cladophialophora carrionii]|uniref:Uncharacterized protein n=1 Tax=Cladophialophora carrionii TaxID=86049 RepID=A0A1C1CJH0_9EURO|nr:hypothetical protein CLCR_05273 [Cladophialophora carrionii]